MALLATAIMFLLSDFEVGVMAAVGGGISLVLTIGLMVVGKAKILHAIVAVLIGGGFGAVGGALMYLATHPEVHLDNQFDDAVAIYVDGDKVTTLRGGAHETIRVYKGKHEFGYSSTDDDEPGDTVKANVSMGGDHLYNPGKSACYWLSVAVYGEADAGDMEWGPQPIKEFYEFETVDNWFADNPEWVTVNEDSDGTTQTSIQRPNGCMEFNKCKMSVRDKLQRCLAKAAKKKDDDAWIEAAQGCTKAAAAKCDPNAEQPKATPSKKKKKKKPKSGF